jgi:hypothetical protein
MNFLTCHALFGIGKKTTSVEQQNKAYLDNREKKLRAEITQLHESVHAARKKLKNNTNYQILRAHNEIKHPNELEEEQNIRDLEAKLSTKQAELKGFLKADSSIIEQ